MSEVLKFFGDKDNYFITESTDKGNGDLFFPRGHTDPQIPQILTSLNRGPNAFDKNSSVFPVHPGPALLPTRLAGVR